jgi:uncharacterized protein (TIGR03085 family)
MTGKGLGRQEREALADLLAATDPAAPTLCEGWDAAWLAAHVVVRDRRPDAGPGLVIPALHGHTERVERRTRERVPYAELVARVRSGPPFSPIRLRPLDDAVNTVEFAIHHEDVRRGTPGWTPREVPAELDAALRGRLRGMGRLMLRKVRVPVVLATPDGQRIPGRGGAGDPVVVTGEPLELTLYVSGRRDAARVAITGPADAVAQLANARLGL